MWNWHTETYFYEFSARFINSSAMSFITCAKKFATYMSFICCGNQKRRSHDITYKWNVRNPTLFLQTWSLWRENNFIGRAKLFGMWGGRPTLSFPFNLPGNNICTKFKYYAIICNGLWLGVHIINSTYNKRKCCAWNIF